MSEKENESEKAIDPNISKTPFGTFKCNRTNLIGIGVIKDTTGKVITIICGRHDKGMCTADGARGICPNKIYTRPKKEGDK